MLTTVLSNFRAAVRVLLMPFHILLEQVKLMMSHERTCHEIVTNFFFSTCRQRPPLTHAALQAISHYGLIATMHPHEDKEADFIPLITGSAAEFYIEPMLPHVGDIDVMCHWSTQLAIPRGHPPPTQLPAEFNSNVKAYEIVDSHLPGYVYLELRYFLTECVEDDNFSYIEYANGEYLSNIRPGYSDDDRNKLIHGPAILTESYASLSLPVDNVRCVRCLSWPPQAADWPTRHRSYDWPDSATVDRVVNNGCDVVGVAHRQCRQHEWMGKHQWRLSFSRAEIVLINSWMPVQQIVYHMLRAFVKTELLAESGNNSGALSNYHIKTLMMWACERESSSFWTNDLVKICAELLHTLFVWLTDVRCQHYFINDCNLIDKSPGVEMIAGILNLIDEPWLLTWFVNRYIRKCSMRCPDNVSRLFSDVSTNRKLQKAVSAVVNCRLNTTPLDTWRMFHSAVLLVAHYVSKFFLTVRSCTVWMTELAKTDTRILVHFTAVAFLHVAYKLSKVGCTDELMDVLAAVLTAGQIVSRRRHHSQCSSELSLSKATKLMKVVANSSQSTMQLIEIELSKAYLYRSLRCKDSDSDSIYCLANVYLAVLYYTTGQYQTAIDHCTVVTRSQDHSQCSSHVVQGELLPKIDNDIDTVLGLAVFYQYVRTAALSQRQTQHVNVFTTELLAHFLNIRCLAVTQTSSSDEVLRLINYINNAQMSIADVLASKSVFHGFHSQPITVYSSSPRASVLPTDLNTSDLVELLQQSAVEHLTTYRQLEARDIGSVATIVTTDYEALYAYKHGDYQRCLQLSTENVRTLLYPVRGICQSTFSPLSSSFYGLHTPIIPVLPLFIQLLDDDIVSLTALTLIVDLKCRDWNYNIVVSQLTVSLYLMTQCQLKLRHSVTALAETLHYIKVAQEKLILSPRRTTDYLTLKLMERKILQFLSNSVTTAFLQDHL